MKAIVRAFAAAVRRAPLVIVLLSIAVTAALGVFAGQVEIATGNEGFAPDNAEIEASERIAELFASDQETVMQILVRDPGGDVISSDGVAATMAVEEAVRRVAGDSLADSAQRPGVISFLSPVVQAAQMQNLPIDALDDATIDTIYESAFAEMPAEQAGYLRSLVPAETAGATSASGMILVFSRVDAEDAVEAMDEQMALDEAIAEELAAIDTDLEIRPFSFNLLFGEVDSISSEVGRLFAFAGIIIVVILLFVYWLWPRGESRLSQSVRRTVADTLLTMVTIFMAIGMMQGAGVLLEKAGVISAFSAPTQIVPILIIGLGVDYAIHIISRYREELGEGDSVDHAMTISLGTSGVALVLATLTTVIGFLTNLANPVPALADFGILAALGIFFSFLLMMMFVPSFRLLMDRRAERSNDLPRDALATHGDRLLPQLMGRAAVIAERIPWVALVLALVLGGLGFYGFTQLETRFAFTDFLPEDAPAVETLELLETEFGGGFGEQSQVLVTAPNG
ncbi:MAG TPA: MMPL family transporter, partial [Acidimicrobiia bacterium]|nr:MMPL family transporter [Acidimicrobiia bacterium]